MKAEDYFVGPAIDITHMTVLRPGELLTTIRIPATWAGAQFYFEKVRDRNVWDFPLVNVASAIKVSGNDDSAGADRGGGGGGAAAAADGGRSGDCRASRATKRRRRWRASWRSKARRPLRYNGYKIPLMRNLVKRAIRGTGAAATT